MDSGGDKGLEFGLVVSGSWGLETEWREGTAAVSRVAGNRRSGPVPAEVGPFHPVQAVLSTGAHGWVSGMGAPRCLMPLGTVPLRFVPQNRSQRNPGTDWHFQQKAAGPPWPDGRSAPSR